MNAWQDEQNRLENEVERARLADRANWADRPEDVVQADFDRMRAEAEAHGGYARCIQGEVVVALPFHRALGPGHIYSEAGEREFTLSRLCEWHFDLWFPKEEDA